MLFTAACALHRAPPLWPVDWACARAWLRSVWSIYIIYYNDIYFLSPQFVVSSYLWVYLYMIILQNFWVDSLHGLPTTEVTLPTLLKQANYRQDLSAFVYAGCISTYKNMSSVIVSALQLLARWILEYFFSRCFFSFWD